jgi:hypothetical protein
MVTDWDRYLDEFHAARAGITEAVLGRAHDEEGMNPYAWLVEPVSHSATVVDLACGSAPM